MTETEGMVTIDPAILDYSATRLSPAMLRVLLFLDSAAGKDAYTVATNERISLATGLKDRTLTKALEDCESSGWILRAFLGPKRLVRTAIILTRRIGPGTPAADSPEAIREAKKVLAKRLGRSWPYRSHL